MNLLISLAFWMAFGAARGDIQNILFGMLLFCLRFVMACITSVGGGPIGVAFFTHPSSAAVVPWEGMLESRIRPGRSIVTLRALTVKVVGRAVVT
jgi:hypothetical protein